MEKKYIRKRKRHNNLSLIEKCELISIIEKGKTPRQVAKENDLPRSTVYTIWSKRDHIKRHVNEINFNQNTKKIRPCQHPDLDEAIFYWFNQAKLKNLPITGSILQQRALLFAMVMNVKKFEASNGWLESFKIRKNITPKTMCGQLVDEWKENEIHKILEKYSPKDIFNVDETGLFYRLMPNKTLAFKGEKCSGGKQSEERLTVLVGSNMDGTEKLPLLVIGKFAKPSCFKNISQLPLNYESNQKAYMTGKIFTKWLRQLDKEISDQNRNILMLFDNCPAHHVPEGLRAITVRLLPSKPTSKLQPMDMGIILDLKKRYRWRLLARVLPQIMDPGFSLNVLDALELLESAWNSVPRSTIQNCFSHAGFGAALIEEVDLTIDVYEECAKAIPNFEEFVKVDEDLETAAELTMKEIIQIVKKTHNELEEDERPEVEKVFSPTEMVATLHSINNFVRTINIPDERRQQCSEMLIFLERKCLESMDV